jgi:two-component system, OmpR family, phosphate regulon response regulator PhoB
MTEDPRVLIADDDADILRLVERRLGHRGYAISTASNGIEAFEAATNDPPDVAIVDWVMPGLEGAELCRRLRSDERTATLPIVLLTARAAEADIHEGLEAGANAFLTKPFDIGELDQVLRRLIEAQSKDGGEGA